MSNLKGTNSDDTLVGGDEDDKLTGGNGDDSLEGGEGADTLDGGNGDDTLIAGMGADSVTGGNGKDYVDAGGGSDTVSTGNGNDVVFHSISENLDSADNYLAGNGSDTLLLQLTQSQYAEISSSSALGDFAAAGNSTFSFANYGFSFNFDLSVKGFEAIEFDVVEETVDTTPPTLIDFELGATTVDVSTGVQTVDVTIVVSDDLSGFSNDSGFGNGSIDVRAGDGSNPVGFGSLSFEGGDPRNTTFHLTLEFIEHSPAGTYPINLTLYDSAGNGVFFSPDDLAAMGFPGSIDVISPEPDILSPTLTDFTVDASVVDVSDGDATLHFTIEASDDYGFGREGTGNGALFLQGPGNFGVGSLPLVMEMGPNGVFEVEVTIPQGAATGVYDISLFLTDDVYHTTMLGAADLDALGFVSQITVTDDGLIG